MSRTRHLLALVLLVVLLAIGGLADRATRRGASSREAVAMPSAAPARALSSTWYCAGTTASGAGPAEGTVIVANPTARPVRGTVTFVAADPRVAPVPVSVAIPARDRIVLAHHDYLRSSYGAALVELQGGEVAVEQSVSGPLGADVGPCASSASDRWYFADGGTTRDARETICLFNPFPEDAVVDLSFTTEQGLEEPSAQQGVVVPARGLIPVEVGEQVLRRRAVSATVSARIGRVVAERIQTYDGTDTRKGLALVLGAPAPGTLYYFSEGYVADGIVVRYQIYNPSPTEARLSLEIGAEDREAERLELVVPPRGRLTLRANDESRIPKNVGHWVTLRSDNGVGVVAERSIDAAAPAVREGLASTIGARLAAPRWLFPAGVVSPTLDEWVTLQNPGPRPARVSISAISGGHVLPIQGLQAVAIEPGRRQAVRVGNYMGPSGPVLAVSSTEPIVAERGLYRVGTIGISVVPGIPLR